MSLDEFGCLTIAQFEALLDRKTEQHRHDYLCAGTIAAAVYNANPFRAEGSTSLTPLDFCPDYVTPKQKAPEQSLEAQIDLLTAVFGCGPKKPS